MSEVTSGPASAGGPSAGRSGRQAAMFATPVAALATVGSWHEVGGPLAAVLTGLVIWVVWVGSAVLVGRLRGRHHKPASGTSRTNS